MTGVHFPLMLPVNFLAILSFTPLRKTNVTAAPFTQIVSAKGDCPKPTRGGADHASVDSHKRERKYAEKNASVAYCDFRIDISFCSN